MNRTISVEVIFSRNVEWLTHSTDGSMNDEILIYWIKIFNEICKAHNSNLVRWRWSLWISTIIKIFTRFSSGVRSNLKTEWIKNSLSFASADKLRKKKTRTIPERVADWCAVHLFRWWRRRSWKLSLSIQLIVLIKLWVWWEFVAYGIVVEKCANESWMCCGVKSRYTRYIPMDAWLEKYTYAAGNEQAEGLIVGTEAFVAAAATAAAAIRTVAWPILAVVVVRALHVRLQLEKENWDWIKNVKLVCHTKFVHTKFIYFSIRNNSYKILWQRSFFGEL